MSRDIRLLSDPPEIALVPLVPQPQDINLRERQGDIELGFPAVTPPAQAQAEGEAISGTAAVAAEQATVAAVGGLRLVATGVVTAEQATVAAAGGVAISGTGVVTARQASVAAAGTFPITIPDYASDRRRWVLPPTPISGAGAVTAAAAVVRLRGTVTDDDLVLALAA